jgi:iron complex outermembrane receptor protein
MIFSIGAQVDSTLAQSVDNITISATRIATDAAQVPIAISTYQADEVQSIRQQLSLQEYVAAVPGLFSLNANNYAQDLRISIRGFGARAAFGIRGIKIIVDGVPETTPDGQGQIDNLNLGIVDRIEVIRGPASSLYGNASGGVILINTINSLDQPFFELGTAFGSYGMQQYQVSGGTSNESTTFIGQGSYNAGNGYRVNSGYKNWNFNGHLNHRFEDESHLVFNLNYSNSPQADDPGGVNLETRNDDPRAARDRNLMFDTGEEISQLKASLSYNTAVGENGNLSTYAFGATRNFLGFVPFEFGGVVDLERFYYGLGANYSLKSIAQNSVNTFQFGVDFGSQDDTRLRYINANGIQGDLISDQNELYTGLGFYVLDHLDFGNVLVSAGARFDRNAISSVSSFVGLGDAMTDLTYTSFNPSLGISFDISEKDVLFANYSRSFETPSLSELFADPNGGPGLNEDLEPQIANSFELGYRTVGSEKWTAEAVLYLINTTDDLVPFEVEQQIGLTFYRNAGKTKRQGIELTAGYQLSENLSLQAVYTYSDFTYEDFNTVNGDFSGNVMPGIPKHNANISLKNTSNEGFVYHVESRFISSLFANDGNTNEANGYTLVNAQIGYKWNSNGTEFSPYVGINNLFDVDYNDNVRLNAFGGRHYEAGPPLHLFGGIRVRF